MAESKKEIASKDLVADYFGISPYSMKDRVSKGKLIEELGVALKKVSVMVTELYCFRPQHIMFKEMPDTERARLERIRLAWRKSLPWYKRILVR